MGAFKILFSAISLWRASKSQAAAFACAYGNVIVHAQECGERSLTG
jgi:hypothetical protein